MRIGTSSDSSESMTARRRSVRLARPSRRARSLGLALLWLLGATLLAVGLRHGAAAAPAPLPSAGSPPTGGASRLPAALPGSGVPTETITPTRQAGMAPSTIRIPALHVSATIGTASVRDGVLTPPPLPDVVGAWTGSAALDATTGELTLAGHVNWAGMAEFAFARLAYLHAGDLVYTTDQADVQTAWRIVAVTARLKRQGVDPAAFIGPRGARTLVLITCGGPFDAGARSYEANVYVTAHPISLT